MPGRVLSNHGALVALTLAFGVNAPLAQAQPPNVGDHVNIGLNNDTVQSRVTRGG